MTHRHLNLNIFQRELTIFSSLYMAYFLLFSKYATTINLGTLARNLQSKLHFSFFFILI